MGRKHLKRWLLHNFDQRPAILRRNEVAVEHILSAKKLIGIREKVIRDKDGLFGAMEKQEIMLELGDVLWYIAQLSTELGFDLEEVAQLNLEKLSSRSRRGKLSGSGDNR